MKVCFGTHRLNFEDNQSQKILELALNNGCQTIVNSSCINYDKYEEMIESILNNNQKLNPLIISKGGILSDSDKETFLKDVNECIFKSVQNISQTKSKTK